MGTDSRRYLFAIALLLAGGLCVVHSQNYSIDWYNAAGSGGTGSGGQYTISATTGQADAGGPETGGTYSLTGGFWALYAGPTADALVLLVEPLSQTVVAGANVVLSVNVTGQQPITYQWQFDGTNVLGATNSTLALSGIEPTNAGNYTVIVSNSFGSVSSTATGVRVLPVIGCARGVNGLTLSWIGSFVLQTATNVVGPYYDVPNAVSPWVLTITSDPQRFYRLRAVTAGQLGPCVMGNGRFIAGINGLPGYNYVVLASTNLINWIPVQTNPAPYVFIDTDATNYPCRFYRTVFSP